MLRDDQLIKWGKLNGNGGIIVGLCLFITGAAVFLFGEKMIGNILEKNVALSEEMLGQVVVEDPKGFVEIIISGQRRIDQGVVDAFGGVSVFLGGMGILCFMLGFLYLRIQQILLDKRALERRLEEIAQNTAKPLEP